MKSFSFKALALSFVVVAGSANATFTETVKGYVTSAKNGIVNNVKAADRKLFGKLKVQINQSPLSSTFGEEIGAYTKGGYRPFNTLHPYIRNGYARAAVVTAAAAAVVTGVSVAAYKTYRYFRPAAQATEGENVEAEANTEVVA